MRSISLIKSSSLAGGHNTKQSARRLPADNALQSVAYIWQLYLDFKIDLINPTAAGPPDSVTKTSGP